MPTVFGGFVIVPEVYSNFFEAVELEFNHVFSAQQHYGYANPVRILYNDNGDEISVSEYIKRYPKNYDDYNNSNFMSQVRIEYDNNTIVCVNRNPFKNWNVQVGDIDGEFNYHSLVGGTNVFGVGNSDTTSFTLPNNGWVVYYSEIPEPVFCVIAGLFIILKYHT